MSINLVCTKTIFGMFNRHGVKVGPGPRNPGHRDPGTRDSPKFKSGTPGPPSKFKSVIPGPPRRFKRGTFIVTFLHCYIYNMEIIFHE